MAGSHEYVVPDLQRLGRSNRTDAEEHAARLDQPSRGLDQRHHRREAAALRGARLVPALITQHFFKQNITGGAFEALTAAALSQLAIPNFIQGTSADMLTAWGADSANACDFDMRSPSLHDNTRGIRMAYAFQPTVGAGDKTQILLPDLITQPITPSD